MRRRIDMCFDEERKRDERMKNLNVGITDEADQKLDAIMEKKRFRNRGDAVEYLINFAFEKEAT